MITYNLFELNHLCSSFGEGSHSSFFTLFINLLFGYHSFIVQVLCTYIYITLVLSVYLSIFSISENSRNLQKIAEYRRQLKIAEISVFLNTVISQPHLESIHIYYNLKSNLDGSGYTCCMHNQALCANLYMWFHIHDSRHTFYLHSLLHLTH